MPMRWARPSRTAGTYQAASMVSSLAPGIGHGHEDRRQVRVRRASKESPRVIQVKNLNRHLQLNPSRRRRSWPRTPPEPRGERGGRPSTRPVAAFGRAQIEGALLGLEGASSVTLPVRRADSSRKLGIPRRHDRAGSSNTARCFREPGRPISRLARQARAGFERRLGRPLFEIFAALFGFTLIRERDC